MKLKLILIIFLVFFSNCAKSKDDICASLVCRVLWPPFGFKHCGTFIHQCNKYSTESILNQYTLQGFAKKFDPPTSESKTFKNDRKRFLDCSVNKEYCQLVKKPGNIPNELFMKSIRKIGLSYDAERYWVFGPNSNSAADYPFYKNNAITTKISGAVAQHYYHGIWQSSLDSEDLDKLWEVVNQIEIKTYTEGNFKEIRIGQQKEDVLNALFSMKAYYLSIENNSDEKKQPHNPMIDIRHPNLIVHRDEYQEKLAANDIWDLTYDEEGEFYRNISLIFTKNKLVQFVVKSSKYELP